MGSLYLHLGMVFHRNSGAPTMARSQASRIKWGNHRNRFQQKSTEIRDVTDSLDFPLMFTFEVVAQKCNFRNFTKKCDIQWICLGKSHDPILDKPWVMIQSGWISHSWMVDVQSKKKMESHSWKICQSTFKSTCQAKIHLFHLLSKKAEGRSQISWLKPFLPDSHRGWNPGRNNPRESENRVPQKIDDHHIQGEMAV